ncbi:MAG: PQQ-binding-like beta-propeller repeat protein [Bacteroidota bacterium]
MKTNMKISKTFSWIALITTMGLIAILSSCKKEDNNEKVTPSERQLYVFSVPGVGFSVGCPTLVNNFIYIGTSVNLTYLPSTSNYFYKLDETLNKIWEYPLGNKQLRGAASLDNLGNIYFVVDSGRTEAFGNAPIKLYSLDNNGNYLWSKDIGNFDITHGMRSLAIAEDNTIYVSGDKFFAFDINGTIKWTYDNSFASASNSAPIIDPDGNIYFCANHWVFSLDKDENERWLFQSGDIGNSLSSPAFSTDYSHVIIAEWKSIYSRETSTGNLSWKYTFDMNADFRATPAVDDNNIIYIGSHGMGGEKDESTLYALKADGSGILWQNNLGSDFYSSPTLGNDRVLYVGSEGHGNTSDKQNRIHAFNMTNGNILWSAQLHNDVSWGSPVLSNNGILYVTTAYIDGKEPSGLYGFRTNATGLLPNCGSPTFHLSNAHNGRRQ